MKAGKIPSLIVLAFLMLNLLKCADMFGNADCDLKMIFTIKNMDTSSYKIKFGIGYYYPEYSRKELMFYPDTAIIHDIPPGSCYTDSFRWAVNDPTNSRCQYDYAASDFLYIINLNDSNYLREYIHPLCNYCSQNAVEDTFPEKILTTFIDTIVWPCLCDTEYGSIEIDSIHYYQTGVLPCISAIISYTFKPDDSTWGLEQCKFCYNYSNNSSYHSSVLIHGSSGYCDSVQFDSAGIKVGQTYSSYFAYSIYSRCNRGRCVIPDLEKYNPY